MSRLALLAVVALLVVKTDAFLCLAPPADTTDPAVCSALDLCNTTNNAFGGIAKVQGAAHGRVVGAGRQNQAQEGVGLHHGQG